MIRLKSFGYALALVVGTGLRANAAVTPELQRAIREQTFEVVMKKPDDGQVSYEKPLPLELLPFFERNDAYRPVGTAFTLGHNIFVTAAHVLVAGIGSQYGAPSIRLPDGRVFPIGTVLKFSLAEDFVVFSLRDDLKVSGFPVDLTPKIDDSVMAVGNALGEGVVIRDGLFTSQTPEDKDGRWKWIRFSAAASPGNSGGPLLDGSGMVIGVVIGKSPNENLNYALPISRVLDFHEDKAVFDQRTLMRLPYLHGTYTYNYKDEFRLPLAWPQFVTTFKSVVDRHNGEGREALLTAYASELFPKGPGSDDLLFEAQTGDCLPRLVVQDAEGRWNASTPDYKTVDLPADGSVSVGGAAGAMLLRLVRSDGATTDEFYKDSKAFMDLALKALDLRRPVGQDQVRLTSLGAAQSDTVFVDAYGRKWQRRIWPVPVMDHYVVGLLLPTPDGYDAILQYVPSSALSEAEAQTRLLANQTDLSYRGSVAQWQSFLLRRDWLPASLATVKLEAAAPWTLRTPRLSASLPSAVLSLTSKSRLRLVMGLMKDHQATVWDVQEVWWSQDDRETASVGLWRRARPASDVKLELRNEFLNMSERRSPYDGTMTRDTADTFSITQIKPAPSNKTGFLSSDLLYGLTVRLTGHPSIQGATQAVQSLDAATQILETGSGEAAAPKVAVSDFDKEFNNWKKELLAREAPVDAARGKDIAGRRLNEYLIDYANATQREMATMPVGTMDEETWMKVQGEREEFLQAYWDLYPALTHNKEAWPAFLARNHMPPTTQHGESVVTLQTQLMEVLKNPLPTKESGVLGRKLLTAYIEERGALVKTARSPPTYLARVSACGAPALVTSGRKVPGVDRTPRSAEDFWPLESKRLGEEGTVMVSIKISATGCATAASIVGSSGFESLDHAVMEFYETIRFLPAEENGKAIESTATMPVVFKLR